MTPLPRASWIPTLSYSVSGALSVAGARVFSGLLLVGVSCACVSGATTGAANLDATLARRPGARVIPKSARFAPAPLRGGQWASYLVGENTQTPFVYTFKVLERGDLPFSFWFEEEFQDRASRVVARSQFLMDESRVAVAGAQNAFEPVITDFGRNIRTVVSEGGGSPKELLRNETPSGLYVLKSRAAFFGGTEAHRPRKAKVRGGEFAGCFEAAGTLTLEGREGPVSGCLDPQVPIHGLVEGRDPLGRRWELVDFGFSGAASAL